MYVRSCLDLMGPPKDSRTQGGYKSPYHLHASVPAPNSEELGPGGPPQNQHSLSSVPPPSPGTPSHTSAQGTGL